VSVGETLSRAREERGLSVDDVSTATRIRAGLIRQIEADDFHGCGGAVYARGHIRSIARVVGIDPAPLVADYDREHVEDAPPALVPTPAIDPDAAAHADRRRPNWTAAMAAALVAICVLAGVSLAGNWTSGSGNTAGRDDSDIVLPTTPPPTTAPPASPPADSVSQLPTDKAVALVRVTSDRTWMSVTTFSGQVLFEGLMSAGEHKVFRDTKGLRLTIGNAPVVNLVANGREIGAPKSEGNVAHISIPRGGTVQYA
jgi:cytoskeletal protein RodZ